MVPPPIALGLTLCELVIVEEGTKRPSLIRILGRFVAPQFPFVPPPFFVHVALTGGQGNATITLKLTRLDQFEDIYIRERKDHFADKLREVHLIFPISSCSFPALGIYQAALLVDGDPVAQRRFFVAGPQETGS